jgi:hypothetical protein
MPFGTGVANKHVGLYPLLVSITDRMGSLPQDDAPCGTTGTGPAED